MQNRVWKSILGLAILLLLLAVACGGVASTPVIIEKEVVIEVVKEVVVVKEVIKEVPVEKIVTKEVVIEVVKEVLVTATPMPTPTFTPAPPKVCDEKGSEELELRPIDEAPWIQAEITTLDDTKWEVWFRTGDAPRIAFDVFQRLREYSPCRLTMVEVVESENGPPMFRIAFDLENLDQVPIVQRGEYGYDSLGFYLGEKDPSSLEEEFKHLTRQFLEYSTADKQVEA